MKIFTSGKNIILLFSLLLFCSLTTIQAQSVFGKWKTIDDNTGEAKSVIEIYEKNGKVFGKVIQILKKERQNVTCENCTGADKDQPVLGLEIIRGLSKDGEEYNDGKILDPENGKFYKCYITLEDKNTLKVRGYIGFSLIGRTQYWVRVAQ